MTKEELAWEIARGLIETGVEGGYDAVSCSTAGDYPSIGCSQWEGGRANDLLERIPGGSHYAYRTYSDLWTTRELDALSQLLDSLEGQAAQLQKLAEDSEDYVEELFHVLDDARCVIYAGIWCPTSTSVVCRFIGNRAEWGYDVNDLAELYELFRDDYARAASCEEYADGYANRAQRTFEYVSALDLSRYGVPAFEG